MDNYIKGYMAKEAVDPVVTPSILLAIGIPLLISGGLAGFSGYSNRKQQREWERRQAAQDARNKARTDVSRFGVGGSALGGMLGYALADEDDRLKWGVKGALLGGGAGALAGMARGMNYFNEGTA